MLHHYAAMLGLAAPFPAGVAFALVWLAILLAWSPAADWIATRLVADPPRLGAFRGLKQARAKLTLGIVIAWILGGFVEEVLLRGIVLQAVETGTAPITGLLAADALGILAAAGLAFVLHLYQGQRAALIVAQLSVLFGLLFVVS